MPLIRVCEVCGKPRVRKIMYRGKGGEPICLRCIQPILDDLSTMKTKGLPLNESAAYFQEG